MLTIAITECDSITAKQNYFFRAIQNFELNIFLMDRFFYQQTTNDFIKYLSEWLEDR